MYEDLNELRELTDDERAALESIPDDAVSHWCQGEMWDFKKKTWLTDLTQPSE